jgi:hypothetical protein
MEKENRAFTRLAMHLKADMFLKDRTIKGQIENLSLKGVFIVAGEKLDLHQVVSISINNSLACRVRAKVVRVTDEGIGFEFEKTLLD